MSTLDTTPNYALELPHDSNTLAVDVHRIRSAITQADAILAGKSDDDHRHVPSDIDGLDSALSSYATNTRVEAVEQTNVTQGASIVTLGNRMLAAEQDKVDKTVTLPSAQDLNAVVETGFYRVNGTSTLNLPSVSAAYGQLIVSRGGDTISQTLWDHISAKPWFRVGSGIGAAPTWTGWVRAATDGQVDDILLHNLPAGMSSMTLNRSGGILTSVSFVKNGKSGTITLNRTDGLLTSVVTVWDGRTRTETLSRTDGLLTSVTATGA